MKIIKHTLETTDPIRIIPIADIHIGDKNVDYDLLERTIQETLKPNTYCVLLGDLLNVGIAGSKSDVYTEEMTVYDAIGMAVSYLRPLAEASKILGIVPGNHEDRLSRGVGLGPCAIIADALGCSDVYSPNSTLIYVRFGSSPRDPSGKRKQVYTLYCNHGNGGGRLPGSKINAANNLSQIIVSDLFLTGHVHQPSVWRKQIILPAPQTGGIRYQEEIFVTCNSYLKWDNSYGDRAGFPPTSTNPPIITLQPTEHRVGVIA